MSPPSAKLDSRFTLWCGNLSPKVDEELLYELFLQAGPLEKVLIPKEIDGISKGYGFVIFKHEVSVIYAIELLKDITLFGRRILPQQRLTSNRNLSNQRRASLENHGVHLYENHNTLVYNQNSPVQGFNIPVLGMHAQEAYLQHAQVSPSMGEPMKHGYVQPYLHTDMRNHFRRRTHDGGPMNYESSPYGVNYQNYPPEMYSQNNYSNGRGNFGRFPSAVSSSNIVLSGNDENKGKQRFGNNQSHDWHDERSSEDSQEKSSFRTVYDRRRRPRK